jgi:hypothetical protein
MGRIGERLIDSMGQMTQIHMYSHHVDLLKSRTPGNFTLFAVKCFLSQKKLTELKAKMGLTSKLVK